MKLPPGFDSAIRYYHYLENHVEKGSMEGPDTLILQYRYREPTSGMTDIQITLGELRAACWKEIANEVIAPEDIYKIECALRDRYPSYMPTKITELLHKLEKI